jgi:hypothetical protein
VALGLEQHAVIEYFGNRTAGSDRGHARALAAADFAVEAVVMHQRAPASAPGNVAAREHLHDFHELRFFQAAIRIRAPVEIEKRLLVPLLLGGGLGDDLLRKHVERLVRDADPVEVAVVHRAHHRRAFDEIVARERKDAPLRDALDRMPRAADPLQEGGDAMRGGDLAHEIDVSDIDAQLERGGGD